MKKTLTITVGIALLAAIAAVIIVEHPRVKDSYFTPDTDKLRQVPVGLVVVRPTHFPKAEGLIRHYHENDSLARTVGRNASFQSMMAEAYDCNFTRVVLPSDAPSGGFDFLVTTSSDVRQHLRSAIQKKLGYTAHSETRDTDVLVLKVANPALPGLTPSADNETDDVTYKDGKLFFKHEQLSSILDGLSQGLNEPVLDQTGLTNYYDFSVVWNANIEKSMQHDSFDVAKTGKVLAGWGLGLEATNVPLEMYIVEKAP
jgi:uncharacterized protein (TIGR03435 family)